MPDLNSLLKSADTQPETAPLKKKFSRGIRPDHIARGEVLPVINTKTDNKSETKRKQTDNKSETEVATKWQQTDNKIASSKAEENKIGNKPSTQPATEVATKWQQTDNKPATEVHFSALVGLQREIIILIYNQCKVSRSKSTGPLTLSFVASHIKTTGNSAKVTIQRLEQKQLLKRIESKYGRGGWARFELSESIHRELLQLETDNKLETKWQQTDNKSSTQPATEPTTSSPVVVVSSNFKNTTTTQSSISDEPCFVIPQELSGKVSRRQLSEFVLAGKISEYDLQLSLDAFAYDLKQNAVQTRNKNNPIAILIGAIKNNGSYNSAKYAELLKSELRPFIESQREASAQKQELKASKEWEIFQTFKQENPDDYKNLEQKVLDLGFKGALLEEFTYLEYKKEVLKVGEELNLNPLRPMEHITS